MMTDDEIAKYRRYLARIQPVANEIEQRIFAYGAKPPDAKPDYTKAEFEMWRLHGYYAKALDEIERLRDLAERLQEARAELRTEAETLLVERDTAEAQNAALREIVQAVAGLDARQSEVWNEVGLYHDSVNVLFIREKARKLLDKETT